MMTFASIVASRPQVHAAYDCGLPDRTNASSWLDFGWEYLDVLHFGGKTLAVQRNGTATWMSPDRCNPTVHAGEAALVAHAHSQGLRVLLAVHWNNSLGPDALHQFLSDPVAMQESARSACARAHAARCDGLSVDFEVANTRFNETFKGLYARYIRRLSAFATEKGLSVVPTLFMDLPRDTGVDGEAVAAATSSGVVLMTYDYHWGCSDSVAGPNTPLIGNNGSNINATVGWALSHSMPAADLLMGIAWYGREYPTTRPDYQAPTNCTRALPDQQARAFSLPQALERAETLGQGGKLWDATSQTPWYRFQDQRRPYLWWEGYFDDNRSLALKYDLVTDRGLKGVLIWMLNGCTQAQAPGLWHGLARAFGKRSYSL